jgi:hypothetical protein
LGIYSPTASLLFAIAAASALSVRQARALSGRQTGSWARPETDRIFVDALRRHFPGGTIKELPHHINDAASPTSASLSWPVYFRKKKQVGAAFCTFRLPGGSRCAANAVESGNPLCQEWT